MKHRCKCILENLLETIGNTPLIPIRLPGELSSSATIYGKLEFFNPSGSVKDRIAKYIIEMAEKRGVLKKDSIIVEATSGNTGIALSMVGAAKGYKVVIIMPEHMSQERIKIMQSFGAKVILTPKKGGFIEPVKRTEEMARKNPKVFLPCQFSNEDNTETHRLTTGQEIIRQTNGKIDAFVAGIGTGGTLMGVAKAIRDANIKAKVVAVEPTEAAILSGEAEMCGHGIQGIGDGFIPEIVKPEEIDEVVKVKTRDAIRIAKRLIQELGIPVGISSGANYFAARAIARRLGKDKTVVTIMADRMERYFSTDLF
ncbi:MAG: cysteine synthase A [Planctomycetota bacterium]|nr:cysteine synthase A [Planctomycetota bacterium]MDI6786826.1 cysteine synthase A [Planctomycetota bacterium]